MEEYFENESDLLLEDTREDFEDIWKRNIVQATLIRQSNPTSGDYFSEDTDPGESKRDFWINIQGISSQAYKRITAGLITPDSTLHGYVRWDEDIKNLDIIKFGSFLYRIVDFNEAFYSGNFVFKEFNLKKIDAA
jgi:hypothetical protein